MPGKGKRRSKFSMQKTALHTYNIWYKIAGAILFSAVLVVYGIAHTTSANAQVANRKITIVPPSISLSANPGDSKEGILKVINESDESLSFTASTQDFIVTDTIGTPNFVPQGTFAKQFSAAAWIGVVPDNFTIAPHDSIALHYYMQIPKNARPGGHYAGVLYTPVQSLSSKTTGPAVQTQIGTLFSVDIAGNIHEEATITKFMAEHGFYEYGPVSILTQIKNLGDLHIKPLASIVITDMLGRRVGVIPLDQHNIFPLAARDYVNIFGQKWMIGPFTATLAGSFGRDGNLPLAASMTFWVFPWKVAIVILLAIVAGILAYFVWKRKKGPKEPQPEAEQPQHIPVPEQPIHQQG